MTDNYTSGGQLGWLDEMSTDTVYRDLSVSRYGKEIAGGQYPQNVDYVMREDKPEIKNKKDFDGSITETSLRDASNPVGKAWLDAAKIMHHHITGQPYGGATYQQEQLADESGIPTEALPMQIQALGSETTLVEVPYTDQDYAEWALEFIGDFNYNLPYMGIVTARLGTMDEFDPSTGMTGTKQGNPYSAMLHLMETYDRKNISWAGTGRLFKGLATDPTSYVGLGTLGLAFVGRQGVKQGTKQGVKEMLRKAVMSNAGKAQVAMAATEGGIYTGLDGSARQAVRIMSGFQEEFQFDQLAKDTLTGMLFGGAIQLGAIGLHKIVPLNRELDKVYATANDAQNNLVSFLKTNLEGGRIGPDGVYTDISAYNVADPSIKNYSTTKQKVKRKQQLTGQKVKAEDIKDVVRTAVVVDNPKDAEDIVQLLGKDFEILEDGYEAYSGGYFDRKVSVRTPEGNIAEIQFWSKGIADVKEDMHALYTEARELEPKIKNNQATPAEREQYEKLLTASDILAAQALVADLPAWGEIYGQIGLDVQPYVDMIQQAQGAF